jgi:hypothetical protein
MKLLPFALTFFLITSAIFADNRDVDHDPQADFSKFKTFTLREGTIAAKAPDLNSPLVRKKIDEAIRTQFAAKGLREVQNQADLIVTYRLRPRGAMLKLFPLDVGEDGAGSKDTSLTKEL